MAFALVQQIAAQASSATLGATATSGHLIVVTATWRSGTGAAVPTGFTQRALVGSINGDGCMICSKISAGTEAAIAMNGTLGNATIEVTEWSGNAASGSEFDAASAGATGSSTTGTPGSLTPAGSATDELFVVVEGFTTGTHNPFSIDSGFTLLDTGTFTRAAHGYKIKTDALAENPTITALTGPWLCIQAAFKAAAVVASSLPDRQYPRGHARGVARGVA